MFSLLRKRVTLANVLLIFALVLAMSGGAFAAGKYLITSTKQISPKVLKDLKGKAGANGAAGAQGPAGPVGPAGPAGPAGKGEKGDKGETGATGKEGTPGTAGKDGESVTSKAFSGAKTAGSQKCSDGGTEFVSASGTTLACNGEEGNPGKNGTNGTNGATGSQGPEGSPWTDGGTLPSKSSETGAWSAVGMPVETASIFPGADIVVDTISFPIPLTAEVKADVIGFEEGEGEAKPAGAITAHECEGTYKDPKAAPGLLCLFVGNGGQEFYKAPENVAAIFPKSLETEDWPDASRTGALVMAFAEKEGKQVAADGTWAVTAP